MRVEVESRLSSSLKTSDKVVDVGGGAAPFFRADYVIDAIPYEQRASLIRGHAPRTERFSDKTWIHQDLCSRQRWPFPDNFFDYATCSHLLEDVRDPIWVCQEMSRVAKAGYIETPSRIVEQSRGVEHPLYAGYYHHRWLVSDEAGKLCFRFKPHSLHTIRAAIVCDVGVTRRINPKYEALTFEWTDSIDAHELLEFDESLVAEELCAYARSMRALPDLFVPNELPLLSNLRRLWYFTRLRRRLR